MFQLGKSFSFFLFFSILKAGIAEYHAVFASFSHAAEESSLNDRQQI